MSELKVYHCNEWKNEYTEFYIKSEADKVIAEKDEEIAELKKGAKNLIIDNYLKDKEIRHQKQKRCLANAEACMHKRWRPDEGFDYARSTRHMNKWRELAEKFKPNNSTAQQGKG